MGTILSKGFKLPATGDRDWWTQLEFDIQQLNSHSHNGVDSEKISPGDFDKGTSNIDSADWAAVVGQTGTYSQTVTVPSGYAVDTMQVKFYIDGGSEDGDEVYLSVRKASSLTYDVFINDNSISLVAIYG